MASSSWYTGDHEQRVRRPSAAPRAAGTPWRPVPARRSAPTAPSRSRCRRCRRRRAGTTCCRRRRSSPLPVPVVIVHLGLPYQCWNSIAMIDEARERGKRRGREDGHAGARRGRRGGDREPPRSAAPSGRAPGGRVRSGRWRRPTLSPRTASAASSAKQIGMKRTCSHGRYEAAALPATIAGQPGSRVASPRRSRSGCTAARTPRDRAARSTRRAAGWRPRSPTPPTRTPGGSSAVAPSRRITANSASAASASIRTSSSRTHRIGSSCQSPIHTAGTSSEPDARRRGWRCHPSSSGGRVRERRDAEEVDQVLLVRDPGGRDRGRRRAPC